ncbi:unnamed protein product [Allacma fusca]|uniref:Mitochondrial 28S ribosomal protein S27 n=1 Tax=Allacma fusca TaxID=39272 RepID=A0A8J2MEP7_9HEXA|nr:unnamed protein product [Allacma fusca]
MSLFRGFLQVRRISRALCTSAILRDPGGYLPESYKCSDAWNKRLESSIIQKIELDDFFFEMDQQYKSDQLISAVDVDLFANKITTEEYLEELEELAHRLRKSPATHATLPSTGHAIIRALIDLKRTDILLRVLNDRFNYGIFTDNYLSNILMDMFLEEGNFRDAAKIASLHMIEEDFGGPTTTLYALLSCLKYIENPTSEPWEEVEVLEEKKKSKEETKIRVKYLRQPGFDDHFDLTEPWHIVGKTLALGSLHLKSMDEVLQRSTRLLGWALYDKWEKVENILRIVEDKKLPISSDVLGKLAALVESKLKVIEGSPDKTLPKPKLKRAYGMNLDKEGVAALYARLNIPDYGKIIPSVKATLDSNKIVSVDAPLIPKVEELLKKAITENASMEVTNQIQLYQDWEQIRNQTLLDQVQRVKNEKRLQEIEEQKKELTEREETIFFFENEEEWMLRQPPAVREYKMRWRGKYRPPKTKEDDTYVPPML